MRRAVVPARTKELNPCRYYPEDVRATSYPEEAPHVVDTIQTRGPKRPMRSVLRHSRFATSETTTRVPCAGAAQMEPAIGLEPMTC